MRIIVCVDERFGMMFHNRRQSQDRGLRKRILELTAGKTLRMNHYSYKQFEKDEKITDSNLICQEGFLSCAEEDDYCFVEDADIQPYLPQIKTIVLYKWNRSYPFDWKFSLDLIGWTLQSVREFAGSSHERITEEIYIRE